MSPTFQQFAALFCLAAATLHSFSVNKIERIARLSKQNSFLQLFLHWMAEIEFAFAFWALAFLGCIFFSQTLTTTQEWFSQNSFREPFFVLIIMLIASTSSILCLSENLLVRIAKILPLPKAYGFYWLTLILGPLLGSFITEPAAMTVTALLLHQNLFSKTKNQKLIYSITACLFVNISIGGTLTSFAAPPVIMISKIWNWDSLYLFQHFGWKSILAIFLNTSLTLLFNQKELKRILADSPRSTQVLPALQLSITSLTLFFLLIFIILFSHVWLALFTAFLILLFLNFIPTACPFKWKESFAVSVFLASLVILTTDQNWWLEPILNSLQNFSLFCSTTLLTGFIDNAAITALAGKVTSLTLASKTAILAGSVAGGGLTLIANAPNPAGYSLLKSNFGPLGINPILFFFYALFPTLIAGACLWIL